LKSAASVTATEMKKPLRTIQVLADWFDDYTAKRQDRMLRHFYAPKVAEKAKRLGSVSATAKRMELRE
jgi:hypothetical protein